MKQNENKQTPRSPEKEPRRPRRELTIEELEERIAPATIDKKVPQPPPYGVGTDYGLMRRDNLSW